MKYSTGKQLLKINTSMENYCFLTLLLNKFQCPGMTPGTASFIGTGKADPLQLCIIFLFSMLGAAEHPSTEPESPENAQEDGNWVMLEELSVTACNDETGSFIQRFNQFL